MGQDRLLRNVARFDGGVGAEDPPVDRFTDDELSRILATAAGHGDHEVHELTCSFVP